MSTLSMMDDKLQLRCEFLERDKAKHIPGARWNAIAKCWEYPVKPETVSAILMIFPRLDMPADLQQRIRELAAKEIQLLDAKKEGWEHAVPLEPIPLRTIPFKHQIAAYNMGIEIPNLALLLEQGTGKSLTTVAIAGRRFLRGEIQKVLVVAPASVVPVWPKEFEDHADFPFDVRTLEGPSTKRAEMLRIWDAQRPDGRLRIAVINYEACWRIEPALTAWRPDMIVADEAQRIKTPGAQQSKALHRLAKIAKYRLLLTGTPITQGPLDFFSQYKFLDPTIFGQSYYAFRNRYAVMGGYENHQVVAYKNMPELIQKAHRIAIRVTKAEALDLPEYTDQIQYCELEADAERAYKRLARESVAELEHDQVITAANILSKMLRLSQMAGGYVNDDGGSIHQISHAKLTLMEETVTDLLDAGKKVVIFARFLPEMTAIEDVLTKKKAGYARIAGDVNMAARGEEVRRFQEDADCKVFIAQIQTAGLGITLTAADTAIFYSMDFSFANYDQCRARIHRIGQKNACTYIHFVTRGTVDEKVIAALKAKRDVATRIVDDWREFF